MAKKILTKLKRIMTKLSKNFNEALVNTKKKKKIRVEEYSDRNKNTRGNQEQITWYKEWISDLEDRVVETSNQNNENKKGFFK